MALSLKNPLAPERAVIPGESATPAGPELWIAYEGGKELLRRIAANIRTAVRTASSFLPHPIRTQRSTRNPTTSGKPRARRRL